MDESGKAKNVVHTDEKIIYKCIFQHFSKIIDMVIKDGREVADKNL